MSETEAEIVVEEFWVFCETYWGLLRPRNSADLGRFDLSHEVLEPFRRRDFDTATRLLRSWCDAMEELLQQDLSFSFVRHVWGDSLKRSLLK